MVAVPHYPGLAPIDAYGNGGFRFAGMSHRGSLLVLPDGFYAWDVAAPEDITVAIMDEVIRRLAPPAFLLLGTGIAQVFPSPEIRRAFFDAGLGLDPMSTGATCRTYNVLLAEKRTVAAAVLAVA